MVSIGFVIWNVLGALFILSGFCAIVWAAVAELFDTPRALAVLGACGYLLLTVIVTAVGDFPFDMEYHSYREVSGIVSSTNSRLISAGDQGGSNQKFVISYANKGNKQFGCEDTRCASVRKGDFLAMKCIRSWQYASNSGYNCRFVDWKPQQ
jgi:hypothetical protein